MRTKQEIIDTLRLPFAIELVKWRVGSVNKKKGTGMGLAYIDARDVMDRLDLAVGPERWHSRHEIVHNTYLCHIGIEYEVGTITWKSNGAGQSDIEGEKGGLSAASKRAAVEHGVGRYLYHCTSPWLDLQPKGNSWVIAKTPQNESKMNRALGVGEAATRESPPKKPTVATVLRQHNAASKSATLVEEAFPDMDTDGEEFESMKLLPLRWALYEAFQLETTADLDPDGVPKLMEVLKTWKPQ